LAAAFLAECQTAGIDVLVTCTLRSSEEQTILYAQGRTAPGRIVTRAKAGQSAHNYGLAIDVVPMHLGKPVWDDHDPIWDEIGEIGVKHGLEWYGSPGAVFHEKPHFQLANWKTIAGV
jgi:peptidoglycan L-alanyl-D-glutamate endopeptidase CwlK